MKVYDVTPLQLRYLQSGGVYYCGKIDATFTLCIAASAVKKGDVA